MLKLHSFPEYWGQALNGVPKQFFHFPPRAGNLWRFRQISRLPSPRIFLLRVIAYLFEGYLP